VTPVDLVPAIAATVAPTALLLAVTYALRPQAGHHGTCTLCAHPRPAAAILARLHDEVDTGEIPRDLWGGIDRHPADQTSAVKACRICVGEARRWCPDCSPRATDQMETNR